MDLISIRRTNIKDDINNQPNFNNRFDVANGMNDVISGGGTGPFWGCPNALPHLLPRAPRNANGNRINPYVSENNVPLSRLRISEARVHGVQETWKLAYPGSVGSQILTGIPRLRALRFHQALARVSQVWPFEAGFALPNPLPQPFILHAEIWPGIVNAHAAQIGAANPGMVNDQAQVRAMCQWAHQLDQNNLLGPLFGPPAGLNAAQIQHCVQEEGWILGVQ